MDVLRSYLWLWVVVGMVLVSLLISFIFLLINRCLSRAGKRKITQLKKRPDFKVESNKYQVRSLDTPPLPPRTQFVGAASQSYENLAEVPEYEQSSNLQPDYVKVEDEVDLQTAAPLYQRPHQHLKSGVMAVQSYENLAEEHNYEESTADGQQSLVEENQYEEYIADGQQNLDNQPDYVKVEEEAETGAAYDSSEDYDDIGGEENGDEDYDDVG